jgi:hypothetical protein
MESDAGLSGQGGASVPARVRATRYRARQLGLKVNKRGDHYWLLKPRGSAVAIVSHSMSLDDLEQELGRIASERSGESVVEKTEERTDATPVPPTLRVEEPPVGTSWSAIRRWRRRLRVKVG